MMKNIRRKLYEYVVDELGLRIIRGDYHSGDTLPNEESLCKELEVSRGVLREAMKVLIQKGLVESKPKIGTVILPRHSWNLFDPDVLIWKYQAGNKREFLKNVMEVRRIIEAEASKFAAERANTEEIARIRALYDHMAAMLSKQNPDAADSIESLMLNDLRFHSAILEASGNELIAQIGHTMRQALLTARQSDRQDVEAQKATMPSHWQIVEAISRHDSEQAYQAARRHIDQVWQEMQEQLVQERL